MVVLCSLADLLATACATPNYAGGSYAERQVMEECHENTFKRDVPFQTGMRIVFSSVDFTSNNGNVWVFTSSARLIPLKEFVEMQM